MAIGNISNPIEAINAIKDLDTNKYNKTGGEISGDVKVDGNFTLYIEDDDYDSGIHFTRALDDNLGTVLTLTGYADNTNYKPIIRNIGTCVNDYDIANKKYVDDHTLTPDTYLVALTNAGAIDTVTVTLTYNKVKSQLTNKTKDVYLDVLYGSSRFYVRAVQDFDTNNGPIKFIGSYIASDNMLRMIEFTLDSTDVLSVYHYQIEHWAYKVQDIVANYANTLTYPSTAAVYNQFQRKPVVVWESNNPSTYLKGIQADISASPAWQLTNLDLTPFKRIKIYSCAGQKTGTTASASTTPAIILEMSLDTRNAISAYGGNYVGSIMVQKPNDANRFATLTCAVSADKTSFVVLRQTNLYGTAATSNNDVNADVFMIEGYYD